jgi:crotonobetainyl-CoA:carnitine CoA-transferase CaiB-like acyl-CoA transferase
LQWVVRRLWGSNTSTELLAILNEVFASRPGAEWLDVLHAAGVPCGPVNSVAQALADEHTVGRGMVVETEHPRFGTIRRCAVRYGWAATSRSIAAPRCVTRMLRPC